MNIFFVILAVLLLLFIIWQAKLILPRVAAVLPGVKRKLHFEVDVPKFMDEDRKSGIRAVTDKLKASGFTYLGLLVEKAPLWGGSSRELIMVSPAAGVFAYVGLRLGRPAYFFYTPFANGGVVVTAHNAFRNYRKDEFVIATVPSGEAAEMLEVHHLQVEKFKALGRAPFTDYRGESLIKATQQYYGSAYAQRQLRLAGVLNLLYLLVCLFLLAILIKGATG